MKGSGEKILTENEAIDYLQKTRKELLEKEKLEPKKLEELLDGIGRGSKEAGEKLYDEAAGLEIGHIDRILDLFSKVGKEGEGGKLQDWLGLSLVMFSLDSEISKEKMGALGAFLGPERIGKIVGLIDSDKVHDDGKEGLARTLLAVSDGWVFEPDLIDRMDNLCKTGAITGETKAHLEKLVWRARGLSPEKKDGGGT